MTVKPIPLDQLSWVLEWDGADPNRVKSADLTKPILVFWWRDEEADTHRLVVLDGLHRITKALLLQREYIEGIYVNGDDLALCLISNDQIDSMSLTRYLPSLD